MEVEINQDLAEETGWHLGDGSMNYYQNRGKPKGIYQLRGHIEDDKIHYLNRIKPIFDKIYGVSISLREMPSASVFGFQIWNDEIVKFKHQLGLPLGKKIELKIPEKLCTNKKLVTSCIRGIFDTDGCLYLEKKNEKLYPRLQITTISETFANQIIKELTKIDFKATLYSEIRSDERNKQRNYIISIRGVEMLNKFFKEIEPKNQKHIDKYQKFIASAKT